MGEKFSEVAAQGIATGVQAVGTIVGVTNPVAGAVITIGGMTLSQVLAYGFSKAGQREKEWLERRVATIEKACVDHAETLDALPAMVSRHAVDALQESSKRKLAARRAFLLGRVRAGVPKSKEEDVIAEIEAWMESARPLDIQVLLMIPPKPHPSKLGRTMGAWWPHNISLPTIRTISKATGADQDLVQRSLSRLEQAGLVMKKHREMNVHEMQDMSRPGPDGEPPGTYMFALESMGERAVSMLTDFSQELAELENEEAGKKEPPQ